MAATPRTIAARYRILEEAGRGGMGSVWRCVDERLGREVAVKQVGRLPGESVTDRARALREARSSAALNHRNVVSIYDAVAEQDQVWLVMEHVTGRTLAEVVHQDGPLSPERVAWIGAQVADGLAAAHERGTIHRDVKPGNILVQDDDLAKISDFGIARTAGDDTLTQTGMLVGTPAYFAPEIARGGDPSEASDVWALGATLFGAVEGRPPYASNPNALALLSTIVSEEPAQPRRAGPLAAPLRRMLDRDPLARWSMAEVAHALHRVADSALLGDTAHDSRAVPAPVPALSTAPASGPPGGPAPRRRRGGAVLLVAAVAVLVLAIAGALALLGGDPASTPAADRTSGASPTPEERSDGTPEEPGPTATTGPSPSPPSDSRSSAAGDAPASFVEDYYATLPDDTESGYSLLSRSYRAGMSFEEYDGFWSTVDEVQVLDSASAGPRSVDVTLRYDGAQQEVRRIHLERGEEGWRIVDDEVVG